jgi:hypothetical protein
LKPTAPERPVALHIRNWQGPRRLRTNQAAAVSARYDPVNGALLPLRTFGPRSVLAHGALGSSNGRVLWVVLRLPGRGPL